VEQEGGRGVVNEAEEGALHTHAAKCFSWKLWDDLSLVIRYSQEKEADESSIGSPRSEASAHPETLRIVEAAKRAEVATARVST
jgi:hypothetical protein